MKNKPTEWLHEGTTYRLISRTDKERERGYQGLQSNIYNVLQKKSLLGWKDIEKELVPNHIYYELATMGSTDWKSQLYEKCVLEYGLPSVGVEVVEEDGVRVKM